MKPLLNGWRYAAVCTLLAAFPIAAACGGDPNASTNESNESELEILFPQMYSAYDGKHDFQIPAKVVGVKNVKWSTDDEDTVELEKQSDGSVMITVKKAGDVNIIAKAGNLKATAPLHISAATEDNWNDGSERYNNGVTFKPRGDGGGGGGGGDGGAKGERKIDPSLACTNCHNKGGKGGGDVEHTPMQTAGYTDQDLITIFTEARKPAGVAMRITTQEKWSKMHKWTMTEDEKKGLVTYLRSLKPESQGEVDFGGRGGKGGGGGGGNKSGSSTPSAPQ